MTNYVKEAWMRGFDYNDYVSLCNKLRGMVVSEYAYNKWCAYYDYLMQKDFEENT